MIEQWLFSHKYRWTTAPKTPATRSSNLITHFQLSNTINYFQSWYISSSCLLLCSPHSHTQHGREPELQLGWLTYYRLKHRLVSMATCQASSVCLCLCVCTEWLTLSYDLHSTLEGKATKWCSRPGGEVNQCNQNKTTTHYDWICINR